MPPESPVTPAPAVTSVAELLARSARDKPGHVAVITGGRCWSYAELYQAARTTAAGLQRAGVAAGDTVLIALPNTADFFLAFFGTLIAGAIAVPVFPGSAPGRLAAMADLVGARTLIVPASSQAGSADADGMRALARLAARDGRALLTIPELARSGSLLRASAALGELCYIQYTSGSTADPRGAAITHQGLLANIAQMVEAMEITPDDVFVSWLPTYHDMGLTLMALTPFSLGARLVLLPTDLRDVGGWLRAIQDHRGTFTAGPDFAYRLCLRNVREAGRFDLRSLQVCMNASEPVRAATVAGFQSAFGLHDVMMAGYGLAEATLSVTCTRRGAPIEVDERGLVCLGRAMPGTSLEILRPDGSPASLPGEAGEIAVSGPSLCAGYYRNPAATAALAWDGSHVRTGDLGYLHDDRLYFIARQKEVINIAGRSLYPQEVEGLVDELSQVRLSAAVGIDRGGVEGEQLYVFAEVRDASTATDSELSAVASLIVRRLHESLGVRPRSTILLQPRRIPLTSNGKQRRTALRDAYSDGLFRPGDDIVFPPPVRLLSATPSSLLAFPPRGLRPGR